ncbi:DUF3265 domain-containing protein [Vibrio cholerae]|nr:DUF3265 domain-containing protein [Vibrio cholerae]
MPNKLFKSDSQRVAFSLCVAFSVLGGLRRHRYCVAHTLTGRYMRMRVWVIYETKNNMHVGIFYRYHNW